MGMLRVPTVLTHIWNGIKRAVALGKSVKSAYKSIKKGIEDVVESIADVREDLRRDGDAAKSGDAGASEEQKAA